MAETWIDTTSLKTDLSKFFAENKSEINEFGSTVNQTFEAFVFASMISWYANRGWIVTLKHPKTDSSYVKLKYSTRGRPSQYTYAICTKDGHQIQIRHSIRVATRHHKTGQKPPANVCLDVAVIAHHDLSEHKSDDFVENYNLITFGEAKHMSAFAELIANFVGLVHELTPNALISIRPFVGQEAREHPAPFLYVSGYLYPTAQGIVQTIKERGYDIDVLDCESGAVFGVKLPTIHKPKKSKSTHTKATVTS